MASCSPHIHPQDFSDPDTQLSVAGVVLGLVLGLGAPAFYINRTERDEERLEELRALNRAQYQETGEYMSDVSAHWCLRVARALVPCWLWVGSDTSSLASSMLAGMEGETMVEGLGWSACQLWTLCCTASTS